MTASLGNRKTRLQFFSRTDEGTNQIIQHILGHKGKLKKTKTQHPGFFISSFEAFDINDSFDTCF